VTINAQDWRLLTDFRYRTAVRRITERILRQICAVFHRRQQLPAARGRHYAANRLAHRQERTRAVLPADALRRGRRAPARHGAGRGPASGPGRAVPASAGRGLTKLDPVLGRNTWIVWAGGNDRFWDSMTSYTFGAFDLLKIVAYDPSKPVDRAERWKRL